MLIREFIKVLWDDWVALMSGIASIALAFWAAYFPPTDVVAGRTLLWLASVICFILAAYRIWSKEFKARQAAERLLEAERQQKTPALSGKIEQVMTGDIPNVGAQLFIYMAVGNAGAKSVAEGWSLRIEASDFDVTIRPTYIPEELPLYNGSGKHIATLYSRDTIYEKAMTPIECGSVIRGVLRYILEGIPAERIDKPGNKLTVMFADFLGNPYAASYSYTGNKAPPMYLPGAGQPFSNLEEGPPPKPKQTVQRAKKGRSKK
jgi:hypothetical protein